MSESCCTVPAEPASPPSCPASGYEGKQVDWTTVAALATGPLPAKQEFRLCREPDCEVVYYGSAGTVLTMSALNVQPGFKDGSDGLVCYCFLHHKADIARQLREAGETDIYDSIKIEVQAGNCACEVRNPSGKCCLAEVREVTRTLEMELSVQS